jgi:mRNA-degrading endonuclease RelE of RelBE toxin-antitoxin system
VKIVFTREAQKSLVKSNKRALILEKIGLLISNPAALKNNVKQLKGREEQRLRVQDWRVIFLQVEDMIIIKDVAPRSSAYEEKL